MADGFQLNAGVPEKAARENPSGVSAMGALPAMGVPTNVPMIMPSRGNMTSNIQPNSGAMALAQTLGNINFGALTNAFQTRSAAQRKLADEQAGAQAQAETARILAATGKDYSVLVKSGAIPLYKNPAAQLMSGIAAAQHTFGQMQTAVAKRRVENPDAPVFTEDPQFMSQWMDKLNGVRNEAVVKHFLDPMQALAADDNKGLMASYNDKFTEKLHNDTTGAFEQFIGNGAHPGKALDDAMFKLQGSGALDSKSAADLLSKAGPAILRAARKPDGSLDPKLARQLLDELGDTNLQAFSGHRMSSRFQDEYEKIQGYVFNNISREAKAQTDAEAAQMHGATEALIAEMNKPDEFKSKNTNQWITRGVQLGLDHATAMSVVKSYGQGDGIVSSADEAKDKQTADIEQQYDSLTPSEVAQEKKFVHYMRDNGKMTQAEAVARLAKLDRVEGKHQSAPIGPEDRNVITSTLYSQLPTLFGNNETMNTYMRGATTAYRLKTAQTEQAAQRVADKLSLATMTWIQQNPTLWSQYQAAKANIANDQSGPARFMENATMQFLSQNSATLLPKVKAALTGGNPDRDLGRLTLAPVSAPPAATRVYQQPAPQPKQPAANAPKPVAEPKVKAVEVHPVVQIKETADARRELSDLHSSFHSWYANHIRQNHPGYSDIDVMKRINSLPNDAIVKLRGIYKKEHGF